VRLRRLLRQLDNPHKRRRAHLARALPLVIAGLMCHAFGEAVGYVLGAGRVALRYATYELRRREFVTPAERAWMLECPVEFTPAERASETPQSASS
jgi:hypothetical protein